MKASIKTTLFGTGLIALGASIAWAQAPASGTSGEGQRSGRESQGSTGRAGESQGGNSQGGTNQGRNSQERSSQAQGGEARGDHARGGEAMRGGHESRMLIGHAVMMAISGANLKAQAEFAGQSGGQGDQGQAGAQGVQNALGSGRQGGGQGQATGGGDPAQQLMMKARKGMQESRRLLQAAQGDQGSSQKLYTAADNYINTLLSLCGESASQGAGASRTGDAAGDTGRARTGRSSRDEDLGAGGAHGGKALSSRDKTAVALINHSVCDVLEGTHITHMLQSQAGGGSAASEMLRRHGREMTTEGRETLQRFLGSSHSGPGATGSGGANTANASQSREGGAGGQGANAQAGAGGQGGDASVTTLARYGQELIQAIESGSQGGGQGGAFEGSERPGTSREGTSSGSGGTSGAGRSSGTSGSSGSDSSTPGSRGTSGGSGSSSGTGTSGSGSSGSGSSSGGTGAGGQSNPR